MGLVDLRYTAVEGRGGGGTPPVLHRTVLTYDTLRTECSKDGQLSIATVNPTTGETEFVIEAHTPGEVERRIALAEAATLKLGDASFDDRANWLRASADALLGDKEYLSRLITIEMGKPIAQSVAEVEKSAAAMRFYADNAAEFLGDSSLDDPAVVGASKAWTRYEPLGIVLAVMPWNYPIWQVVRFAAPALMAGNAGVLKHASNVPQCAVYLDTLFERGGFPQGAFGSLLIGSRDVAALIADDRVKAVTLTGSEPAGQAVAAYAGENIKKTVLELGGSDPFIVLSSADVKTAASTAVRARTGNNGQSCIAAKRFLVHTDVYDAFANEFATQMTSLVVGDPLDPATDVGPIATASGLEELRLLVADARDKGAQVQATTVMPDIPGFFYPPTVVSGLSGDMRLVQEEAFGPVASIYRFATNAEALEIANQTTFGLSSSVWTAELDEQRYFIENLEAGAVFVNGMTVSHQELPFGGVKRSGYGRELAADGIREFCNLKTVWEA